MEDPVCSVRPSQTLMRSQIRRYREEPLAVEALKARLLLPYRRRQFASFGPQSVLVKPQWLYGTQKIAIGARVIIMPGIWLAAERTGWSNADPILQIGDGVG